MTDCWKTDNEFFEVMKYFNEVFFILLLLKNFLIWQKMLVFLENLFEYYFLNIIVNVNFFSYLKFEYYCEYYLEILLQVSLK